jgi:hypothetical protein
MRNLLRCRRGSVAFALVVAAIPLIGVVALGGEAGSWYVTKQHAQNAADVAAYSGGLRLACSNAAQTGVACADAQSVAYRGKQFAAQNAFCNAGDTSYPGSICATFLGSGVSQTVNIDIGTYAAGSWTTAAGGSFVRATVTQTQPAYLASVLGLKTVNIGAQAIAKVQVLATPCVLALRGSVSFQGSPTVNAPNCGIASNSTSSNAIDFTGNNGINVSNVGSISGEGGCAQTGGSQCSSVISYAPPVPNPLSGLDAAMALLNPSKFSGNCGGSQPTAYDTTRAPLSAHTCVNNGFTFGNSTYNLNGTYFFSGTLKIQGNATITGTATLILLPGATLTITGNPSIQLTALTTVATTQVPSVLSAVVGLMSDLLIYDPESTSNGVKITGNSTSYFRGIVYVPNSAVTYQGSTTQTTGCTEVIAAAVTLSGNSTLDNSACPTILKPQSQYVALVQ